MKLLSSVLFAGLLVSLLTINAAAAVKPAAKPNIVVILADDLGYGDVGCYGATAVQTPNIDRLAREGLRFTNGYCTSATCTPSRYSLMTGEYAFRKSGTGILPGDAAMIIQPGRTTVPSVLQLAGYRTAAVGKWHLGLGDKSKPIDWNGEITPGPCEVGFDYSFIMAATGDRAPCVYVKNHRVVGLVSEDPISVSYKEAYPGEPTGKDNREGLKMDWTEGHNNAVINGIGRIGFMKGGKAALWKDEDMADVFTKEAIDFIDREKSHPFFLYFATHDIHVPRIPNPRFVGKTSMGARGDAIAEFDDSVGRILQKLDDLHLTENTLVILSSDNGPVLDDGYNDQANEKLGEHKPAGPLRGGKYGPFEGGTRVPFVTRWPGRIQPGVSDAIVSQVDFLASFASLAGHKPDGTTAPDSTNMLAAFLGETKAGRQNVLEYSNKVAIREGHWKLVQPGKYRDQLNRWNKVEVTGPGWLFDLDSDVGESKDVAAEHPDVVKALNARMDTLLGGALPQQPKKRE